MKNSIVFLFAFILCLLTLSAQSQSGSVITQHSLSPGFIDSAVNRYNQFTDSTIYDFTLPDNYDKPVKLSDYKNKMVLINFWYTSCGPCVAQIPSEKILFEKLKNQYKDVAWINISIDRDLKHWKQFIARNELPGIHLISLNGGKFNENPFIAELFKVNGFPHYLLLDKKGRLIGHDLSRPSNGLTLEYQIYRGLEGIKSGDAFKEMIIGTPVATKFLLEKIPALYVP